MPIDVTSIRSAFRKATANGAKIDGAKAEHLIRFVRADRLTESEADAFKREAARHKKDCTPEGRKRASAKLSIRFRVLFEYAGVQDVTEHDLRHEATCRWVELRNRGHWVFSEIEVCRIMGWTDTRMMLRYASLRGEDLANRLM